MSAQPATHWRVLLDTQAVCDTAIQRIAQAASQALAERGAFHIVLAGGGTPKAVYEALPALPTDWSRWHVYYGDERCLPPEHAERNSRMAWQAWLSQVAVPAGQHHIMPAELGPVRAAERYAGVVSGVRFDLTLLGLGEDGHTASLFPGNPLGDAAGSADVLAVSNAAKPPPERVSLSAACLSRSREVIFLVSGTGKRDAVRRWRAGEDIPAAHIHCGVGVDVLLESASLPQ